MMEKKKAVLRDLKQMTDEEAIEVARIVVQSSALPNNPSKKFRKQVKEAIKDIQFKVMRARFWSKNTSLGIWHSVKIKNNNSFFQLNISSDFRVKYTNNKNETINFNHNIVSDFLNFRGFNVPTYKYDGLTPVEAGMAVLNKPEKKKGNKK